MSTSSYFPTKTSDELATEQEIATLTLPTDYQLLYEESKAENQRLNDVIVSSRLATTPLGRTQSVKAPVTAERLRALLGPAALLKMTRAEKLSSLGVDPNSITDDGLRKIFGRGNSGAEASDLMKTSPSRYAVLREAAIVLGLYAA